MSDIFDKNVGCLEKIKPDYAKKILEEVEDCGFTVKSEVISDRKVWYLEYPDKIMQLESLYDNNEVSELWVKHIQEGIRFNTKIFVYGIGNPELIRKLIEKTGEENQIIMYEPNFSILKPMMEEVDFTDILENERCTLIMGNCLEDSLRNVYEGYITYTDCYNMYQATSMNYNTIFEEDYKQFLKGVEMALSTVASDYSFYSNSGKYSNKNLFKNIKHLLESKSLEELNKLVDKDVPAIIVAAGPSLSKNINYLKEAKGKSIIICIDAAMRALARANITPDLCITIDFNKELGHFDEGDSTKVPMICSLISTATFVDQSKAVKLFYKDVTPYINEFFDKNDIAYKPLPTGGTVANNALSAAIHMGCKNIIIIGQDLAFTNNKTHAEGTVKGETVTIDKVKHPAEVEDMNGNMLKTCWEFIMYKQWIEETIAARDDIHFINATEGGAGLKGAEHITLKEAIDKYCKKEVDVTALLEKTPPIFTEKQKADFIEYIHGIPDAIKQVEEDALSGRKCYEKMLKLIEKNDYQSPAFIKLYNKTKDLNEKIEKEKASSIVFNEIQHQMNETMKTIFSSEEDDTKSELRVVCLQGKESFDRIVKAAKSIREYIIEQVSEY